MQFGAVYWNLELAAVWCNLVEFGAYWCGFLQFGGVWCNLVLFVQIGTTLCSLV